MERIEGQKFCYGRLNPKDKNWENIITNAARLYVTVWITIVKIPSPRYVPEPVKWVSGQRYSLPGLMS